MTTKPPKPGRAFLGRFMLGHFLAYPICFLTAAAALPFSMMLRRKELLNPTRLGAKWSVLQGVARDLKLSPMEAAQVEMVLEVAMWVCLAVFALLHVAVLPWSFAAARAARDPEGNQPRLRRGLRIFAGTATTTVVVMAIAGTAGWIWVLTR